MASFGNRHDTAAGSLLGSDELRWILELQGVVMADVRRFESVVLKPLLVLWIQRFCSRTPRSLWHKARRSFLPIVNKISWMMRGRAGVAQMLCVEELRWFCESMADPSLEIPLDAFPCSLLYKHQSAGGARIKRNGCPPVDIIPSLRNLVSLVLWYTVACDLRNPGHTLVLLQILTNMWKCSVKICRPCKLDKQFV